jgi:CTP:molybdopterin cytidylyltransferase MocA
MEEPKGLLDFNNRYWLLEQLFNWGKLRGRHAVVVLGFNSEKFFEAIPFLKFALDSVVEFQEVRFRVLINSLPDRGQFSSVYLALEHLAKSQMSDKPVFLLPIDVPLANKETCELLLSKMTDETHAVIPEFEKKGGHPVILGEQLWAQLLSKDPASARLDDEIETSKNSKRVEVNDKKVGININTPEDWKQYLEYCKDQKIKN